MSARSKALKPPKAPSNDVARRRWIAAVARFAAGMQPPDSVGYVMNALRSAYQLGRGDASAAPSGDAGRPVAVAWDAVRAERESALAIEPDALVNAIMGSDLVRLYGIKHVEIVRYHARQIARVYRALAAERAAPATGGHDGKGE